MRILYAIQGTGNGHLSRAIELHPYLSQFGYVDYLLSGYDVEIKPEITITYYAKGLGFIFGKNGDINWWKTLKSMRLTRFMKDIILFPVEKYDIIISDFEPVSAWACRLRNKTCISLSHQNACLEDLKSRAGLKNWLMRCILKQYAPARIRFGWNFTGNNQHIFPAIIPEQLKSLEPAVENHHIIYLPAYSDSFLIAFFSRFTNIKWKIFSKRAIKFYTIANCEIYPVERNSFLQALATCSGVICGAGFETPVEALYLKKKLLVIPMKNQFEQIYNASILEKLGVKTIPFLDNAYMPVIYDWFDQSGEINISFSETPENNLHKLFDEFWAYEIEKKQKSHRRKERLSPEKWLRSWSFR